MISSRDIPNEIKSFWKLFEQLAYRHQYVTVFDDFLTMCVFNFSLDDPNYKSSRDEAMKKYDEKEHKLFNECFFEMLNCIKIQIVDHGEKWFDFFGDLYQTISSNYKSSAMGQFFTPKHVVDAMLQISNIPKDATVSDPCCGSGRMLLATHVHSEGCFVYAQDLDLMCCKMTMLNFVFHGCNGEVVWSNSLDLYDYKKGWRIQPHPIIGLPVISDLPKEQSYIYGVNQNQINKFLLTENHEEKAKIKEQYHDTLFPIELGEPVGQIERINIQKKLYKIKTQVLQEELF